MAASICRDMNGQSQHRVVVTVSPVRVDSVDFSR